MFLDTPLYRCEALEPDLGCTVPAAAVVSAASELSISQMVEVVGADRVETVLVSHDCSDGFGPADQPPTLTPTCALASRAWHGFP